MLILRFLIEYNPLFFNVKGVEIAIYPVYSGGNPVKEIVGLIVTSPSRYLILTTEYTMDAP